MSIDGLLQFAKADLIMDADVLTVYLPKNFKHLKKQVEAAKKSLMAQHDARKVRVEIKSDKEVVMDLSRIDVTISSNITSEIIDLAKVNDEMAIDFETDSVDAMSCKIISVGISFLKSKQTYYIPIAHNGVNNVRYDDVINFLKFASTEVKFVVHNLSFEKKILDRLGIYPEYLDTMIYTYLKGGLRSNKLKDVVKERLSTRMLTFDEVVGKGKNKIDFADVDLDLAAQYCGSDAYYTALLLDLLRNDVKDDLLKLDHNCALVCSNMESRGVVLDKPKLRELRGFCVRRKERLERLIYAAAGEEFNINSPKQLAEIIYGKMGMIPDRKYGKTATGNLATGSKAIDALLRSGEDNRILKHLKAYRNMVKIIGTYIDRMLDGERQDTKRYHGYFKYTGTDTGRLSSDVQQIPSSGIGSKIRECVIAPKGFKVVAADYSQIELRLLAHLMDDQKVNKMIWEGVDLHTATAAAIFDKKPEDIDKDGMERKVGKTMNFAIVYGQGTRATAESLGVKVEQAKEFQRKYFEAFPKLKDLIDNVIQDCKDKGYAETMSGRKRYLPDIKSRNEFMRARAERQAFNALIQGSAADLIRQTMYEVDGLARDFKSELVMQVHDEIVLYVREDFLDVFIDALKKAMEVEYIGNIKINVPIKVDVGVGQTYGDAK